MRAASFSRLEARLVGAANAADVAAVARRIVAEGIAPHAAAGWAARRAHEGWELSVGGDTEAFFDLASLTKPMTALAVARAELPRETALADLIKETEGTPSAEATVELLLAHRAGLEANLPLYLDHPALLQASATSSSAAATLAVARRAAMVACASARRADAAGPIPREGFAPVYSDLGYILVGEALARRTGADCDEALGRFVVDALGLGDALGSARALRGRGVDFDKRVVPTEVVAWRGGEIRGAVHDENAWAVARDGACGHAGMFGTVRAVLELGASLLDAITRGEGGLGQPDLSWLVEARPGGTLRAGFDGKSEGASTAGARAGPNTFGHLGFTGTSLWIDPDAGAVVVLLTNRVHPTRDNVAIRAARPVAHDALWALSRER